MVTTSGRAYTITLPEPDPEEFKAFVAQIELAHAAWLAAQPNGIINDE